MKLSIHWTGVHHSHLVPGLEAHAVIVDVAAGGGGVVLAALRGGRVGPPTAVVVLGAII